MSLSQPQKQSLINQLYLLSTDKQLLPYIDESTAQRITTLLQTVKFPKNSISSMTPTKATKQPLNINKKKHKTQAQEIHQINQQYQEKYAHLFSDDNDNEDSDHILKQIDVQINTNIMGKSMKKKQNNFINNMIGNTDQNHTRSYQPNSTASHSKLPAKAVNSKLLSSKKQNISSLMSTHSNLLHTNNNEQLILKKRPSKEKLISYKIKTQYESKYNYDICTPSPNKLVKKKENTSTKNLLMTSQSRANLQSITKSPIKTSNNNSTTLIKRPNSQSTKLLHPVTASNPSSLNSTSKHQKLPLLRPSQSKSSLSTSKLKSASKKSISVLQTTTGAKRQLNSLPTIELQGNLRTKILKGNDYDNDRTAKAQKLKDKRKSRSKSKSKEKNIQNIKKGIKRSHTQCSVEKLHLTGDFLEQMKLDQELNFDTINNAIKQKKTQISKQDKNNKKLFTEPSNPYSHTQSEQFCFYESSQENQPNEANSHEQNKQNQLKQDEAVPFSQKFHSDLEAYNISEKSTSQLIDDKNAGYECLKRIMGEINDKREDKMRQKVQYERQILQLREKILLQKKQLESTLIANSKLQNQLQSLSTILKSTSLQHTLITRSLNQTRKATTFLKQTFSKNQSTLNKLINQDLKEQQELVQMYNKVIDELKAQIKEQFKKKLQAKGMLELCHKQKQGKMTRFNSTLMSSQRLKSNLTEAFKEWV